MAKKNLSALKRHRQSEQRRLRNKAVKSKIKVLTKKVISTLTSQNLEGAKTSLSAAIPHIAKATSKGVIHKNKASRIISRLSRKVEKLRKAQESSA